jgi:hypothetical protein
MVGITEALSVSGIATEPATTAPRKDSKSDRDGRARSGRRDLWQTGGAPPVMIVYDRDQGIGEIPENLRGRAERRPRRKSRRHIRRGRVQSDPTSKS